MDTIYPNICIWLKLMRHYKLRGVLQYILLDQGIVYIPQIKWYEVGILKIIS